MKRFAFLLLGIYLASAVPCRAALTHDNPTHENLENQGMHWLAATKSKTTSIAPFTSDGCSGGLSAGWSQMASLFDAFEGRYGNTPPWEACCVAHDRLYWRGDTEDGYQKRKSADEQLRQCVIQTGHQQAGDIAQKLGHSTEHVERMFRAAADTIYVAVRLGGGPCSTLPWRWGYGWPHCSITSSDIQDTKPNATE